MGNVQKQFGFISKSLPKRDKKGTQAKEKLKSMFLCEGQLMVEMFCHSLKHMSRICFEHSFLLAKNVSLEAIPLACMALVLWL